MNILIIYAHPNPRSFNQALLETVDVALQAQGHTTCVKDLYRMDFNPILSADDLIRLARQDIPADIRQEQDDIRWAQGLVFIYPIWWFSQPALLKGWLDRVFSRGFAFDFTQTGVLGLLPQRKALVINTLGGGEATYVNNRWHDLIARPMIEGTLGFCGIAQVVHRAFYEVPTVSIAARRAMLEEARLLAQTTFA